MERYTQKSTLTDYVIGAGALAVTLLPGCGAKEDKIAPDPIAQHSLDMEVANAETVNGSNTGNHLELDLRKAEEVFWQYWNSLKDADTTTLRSICTDDSYSMIPSTKQG